MYIDAECTPFVDMFKNENTHMQRKLDDDMLMLNIVTKAETNGGKISEKALLCKITR